MPTGFPSVPAFASTAAPASGSGGNPKPPLCPGPERANECEIGACRRGGCQGRLPERAEPPAVVHDWPIRGRRRQPDEEYGRAYARDPEGWLKRKRADRERRAKAKIHARRQAAGDAQAWRRGGFAT